MTQKSPFISMDEAVEELMRATGKSKRQARYALIEAMRNGELEAWGRNSETGEREKIPPEVWPKIN